MLSRRGFILSGAAAGGGLALVYGAWRLDDGDAAAKFAASGRPAFPLNAWLKIDKDGDVICGIHRAEMGQGVTTGLAQILIEELDADWSRARFEFTPVDRDYFNFGILEDGRPFGDPDASLWAGAGTWAMRRLFHGLGMSLTAASVSIIDAWDTVRPAGAAARHMLLAAAARGWGCDPDALRTDRGVVIDDAGDRRATYGELAAAAAREKPPSDPVLKSPADYRIVGRSVPRLDAPLKIRGTAEFGIDVVRPNMLFATIVHSPVVGTRVAAFDANGAEGLAGVEGVVPAGDEAVAVVAGDTWTAMRAAERVRIEPDLSKPADPDGSLELVNTEGLGERYFRLLDEVDNVVIRDEGRAEAIIDAAPAPVTAAYEVPFLAHECMEPMNCTALYTGDALEVWVGTQGNSVARDAAALTAGLRNEQVTLHSTFLGGGFGRRSEMDYLRQSVSVAMQFPGRPVKLTWSRSQDLRHGTLRPLVVARLRGAVGDDGTIAALDYGVVTQSVSASFFQRIPAPREVDDRDDRYVVAPADRPAYRIDNLKVHYVPVRSHVPAGYWRSVGYTWNPFFIESFVDELASAANTDPLEFRRRALRDHPRYVAVLDALAEAVGPDRTGLGIAIVETHGSVVAHAIEVATRGGRFDRVKRVWCVVDCGRVLHPDNVLAQTEGCIFDGLAAALHGQIDIEDGTIRQRDFDTYARFKLADQPSIRVHLLPSEARPGGVGEVALPGVAPALCNAIFAATGTRIRKLPVLAANP